MPDQFPLPAAQAENSQENKLFDVKRVKINPNDSFDELTKLLEEGYDIVEKLEYNDSQGTIHLYILRKDLRLSDDERKEYEWLKKKYNEDAQKAAKFIQKFGEGDIPEFASHLVANKIANFDFTHCYTQKNHNEDCTDVTLTIKITDVDLYDYSHKKGN